MQIQVLPFFPVTITFVLINLNPSAFAKALGSSIVFYDNYINFEFVCSQLDNIICIFYSSNRQNSYDEYNAVEEPKEPTFTVNTNYRRLNRKNAGFYMWVFTTPLKKQLAYPGVSFMNSSVFSFSERLKMTCHSQYPGLA